MDFTGKVALSTGAASGMGLLFAENIASLGGNGKRCKKIYLSCAEKAMF